MSSGFVCVDARLDISEKDMEETKIVIPKDFLLGAAMSAHQVEGNNTHSDWWYWEELGRLPKSGLACDYWERFAEEHQIADVVPFIFSRNNNSKFRIHIF